MEGIAVAMAGYRRGRGGSVGAPRGRHEQARDSLDVVKVGKLNQDDRTPGHSSLQPLVPHPP